MTSQFMIKLKNEQQWKDLDAHGNEMEISKEGALLMPGLKFSAQNLNPEKFYIVGLHFQLADDGWYLFINQKWTISGKAEVEVSPKRIWAREGVKTGRFWMGNDVDFSWVRITSEKVPDDTSMVPLLPMQKYMPILSVYEIDSPLPKVLSFPTAKFLVVPMISKNEIRQIKFHISQDPRLWILNGAYPRFHGMNTPFIPTPYNPPRVAAQTLFPIASNPEEVFPTGASNSLRNSQAGVVVTNPASLPSLLSTSMPTSPPTLTARSSLVVRPVVKSPAPRGIDDGDEESDNEDEEYDDEEEEEEEEDAHDL